MNNINCELTETIASETIVSETIASETIKNTETDNLTNGGKEIIKTFSHNDKKQLVKRMGDIKSKNCYIKIFKLIHNTTKYTVNDNGVLFNLTTLPDDILTKIERIIVYYEQKKMANEIELKNNMAKNNIRNDSEYTETNNMSENIRSPIKSLNNTK
jgi:hypothetical protein